MAIVLRIGVFPLKGGADLAENKGAVFQGGAMTRRHNHYEAAMEAYLRARRIPYIAVDEAKRALQQEGSSLKSLDFILSAEGGRRWLVDVKGRRFPTGEGKQYWKNWCTTDELQSLAQWERLFAEQIPALLVFAYWLVADQSPVPLNELFAYKDRVYGFIGIRLDHYLSNARVLSRKWNTVTLPTADFRRLARPLNELLVEQPPYSERLPSPITTPALSPSV